MTLEYAETNSIPHLDKIANHQILITTPGRPPLCLKCHKTGHIRQNCLTPFCHHCNIDRELRSILCLNSKTKQHNKTQTSRRNIRKQRKKNDKNKKQRKENKHHKKTTHKQTQTKTIGELPGTKARK